MGTAVEAGYIPDRIYVHQLNLTSADLRRRQEEKEMVEEEARKVKEMKEIKRRQREEEKKRDMEMLLSYNPWGKPGAGAKSEDTKRKKYPEGREITDDVDEELTVEGFNRKFGRPGHGAPNRTNSGRLVTQIKGDPAIRFQDNQDVRLSIENHLRYKKADKENYKVNLDQLIREKQQQQEMEKEWENRKLEEMLEKYPFGKEPNNGGSYLSHSGTDSSSLLWQSQISGTRFVWSTSLLAPYPRTAWYTHGTPAHQQLQNACKCYQPHT